MISQKILTVSDVECGSIQVQVWQMVGRYRPLFLLVGLCYQKFGANVCDDVAMPGITKRERHEIVTPPIPGAEPDIIFLIGAHIIWFLPSVTFSILSLHINREVNDALRGYQA